jgi:uncharacterized protein (TIGR02596 family)
MAIIVMVIAFVAPAASSIGRGTKLTQASQIVGSQLSLARQTAISRNRQIEVRFYKLADPETPGQTANDKSTWKFQAMQSFDVVSAKQAIPLQKVQSLPGGSVVDSGPKLSSILDPAKRTQRDYSDPLPKAGTNYVYYSVRFRPDGSTDLPVTGGPWFLTMHNLKDGDAMTTPPPNFITIEIDPVNGAVKFFRPG